MSNVRMMGAVSRGLVLLMLVLAAAARVDGQAAPQTAAANQPTPTQIATQQDHQRMMDLLGIKEIRPGRSGTAGSPNYANYDESKANPYSNLPDPLVLKNGKKVKDAKTWWNKRRPEIVEDFDREIYGRIDRKRTRLN